MKPSSKPDETEDSASPRALPELHGAILNMDQVHQLLGDIAACTELLEILPKYAAAQKALNGSTLTLAQTAELLESNAVRGIQLRYRYEGAIWCDTLMRASEGYRIVRIRHDW